MPQNLSLPGTDYNPYPQVKVKTRFATKDRLMFFGEFICLRDGVLKDTIINKCPNSEDTEIDNTRFWEMIEEGDIVHTTMPRENTRRKNQNHTQFRADLRQISEQPIDLQKRFADAINKQKELMRIDAGKKVTLTAPAENDTEKTKQVTETTDLPKQLTVAKTNARIKYIQKMTGESTYDSSDIRIYSKVLGDLIDACIELNINPYKS
jgi:hypothetical protein